MSAGVPDEIIRGNGEIAASLPHLLGYRPGDQTVVVVGLVGNRLGPIAVARPPANGEGFNPATCDGFAREVCPALERHGVTTFLTVGYGPTGAEHAHLIGDALGRHVTGGHEVLRWSVDRGLVHSWHETDGWSAGQQVGSGAEWVLRGSSPADSYDQLTASFSPQPARQWPPLPDDKARLLTATPVPDQVVMARDLVRQMIEPGAVNGPAEYGWLGALASGHPSVRDTVMAELASHPAGVWVARAAYVGAPAPCRDALTAVTAVAVITHGLSGELARDLAGRIDPNGPNAHWAFLIGAAVDNHLDPAELRQFLAATRREPEVISLPPRAGRFPGGESSPGPDALPARRAERRAPHKPGQRGGRGPDIGR